MNTTLLLLTPKWQKLFTVGLLHVLLIGSIFVGYDTYDRNNTFSFIQEDGSVISNIAGSDNFYWITEEQTKHDYDTNQLLYQVNILTQENTLFRFPLLDVTQVDHEDDRTYFGFEILTATDQVLVKATESTFRWVYNETTGRYDQFRENSVYNIKLTFDNTKGPKTMSYQLYAYEDNPEVDILDYYYDPASPDVHYGVLKYDNTTYAVSTSGMINFLNQFDTQVRTEPITAAIDAGQNAFPVVENSITLESFLLDNLVNNSSKYTVIEESLDFYDILKVDKKAMHLQVRGDSIDIGEGNYSGNSPEYLYVNLDNNFTQAWDISPFSINIGSYHLRNSQTMQIYPGPTDKVMLLFGGTPISGFYSDHRYWYNSPDFDESAYNTVFQTDTLQLLVFDPAHPTLENYVQFNQQLSQTPQSTVVYPRLSNSTEVPYTNQTSNLKDYVAYTTDLASGGKEMHIYMKLFPFKEGYTTTLHYYNQHGELENGAWLGAYGNMVEFTYNITDIVEFKGTNSVVGPDHGLEDHRIEVPEEDTLGGTPELQQVLESEWRGWAVSYVYATLSRVDNTGMITTYVVLQAVYHPRTPGANQYTASLALLEVKR